MEITDSYRNNILRVALLLVGLITNFYLLAQPTFYIDAEQGADTNKGTSAESPWATLEKVNTHQFIAGSRILFKRGQIWSGQLEPKSSGEAGKPIIFDAYGEATATQPIIAGQGEKLYTVLIKNIEHVEFHNLKITNTAKERIPGLRGVIILGSNYGDLHHIVLNGLTIQHVNGSLIKKDGGGSAILFVQEGDEVPTRFIDLQITNCLLQYCERNGIVAKTYVRSKWYPSLDVYIAHNILENIPGDGIVPQGTHGALIEYNIMRDVPDILPHSEAAAGIWPWSADYTVIQFNEVAGHKAKWDGQGFDSDYNCYGTVIQYNYSHDNYGGFLLVCNPSENLGAEYNYGTIGTVIRGNISINDGIRPYKTERAGWFSPSIHISGLCMGTTIEDNFIVAPESPNDSIHQFIYMGNWGNEFARMTIIQKNIFISSEKATLLANNKGNELHWPQFVQNSLIGYVSPGDAAYSENIKLPYIVKSDLKGFRGIEYWFEKADLRRFIKEK